MCRQDPVVILNDTRVAKESPKVCPVNTILKYICGKEQRLRTRSATSHARVDTAAVGVIAAMVFD